MRRIPGGVLTRAVIGAVIALAAIATVAAAPAGAATRRDDPLPDAAYQSLLDLQSAHDRQVPTATDPAYQSDLGAVAALVAPRTASAPEAFTAAWSAADDVRMTALLWALAEVGVPYRGGASSPGVGFDCSGLTMFAWGQAGVGLPHNDRAQIGASAARTWDSALAGDLVEYPGHVMMYVGAGHAFVDAPHSGAWVRVAEYSGRRAVRLASPLG
jgi:cell wall-associated NlpC family hydrolase